MLGTPAEVARQDQQAAEVKDTLKSAVAVCKEHFKECDSPGCAGRGVMDALDQCIALGRMDIPMNMLSMAIYLLAKGESLNA